MKISSLRQVGLKALTVFVFFLFPFSCRTAKGADEKNQETAVAIELANLYHSREEYAEEERVLKETIAEQGTEADPRLVYNLAYAYYEQKDYEKAIEVCVEWKDSFPAHIRFSRLLGKIYFIQEADEEAEELYKSLVYGIAPEEEDVLNLAALYEKREAHDEKRELIAYVLDSGLITKKILEAAVGEFPENEEYKVLLRYIKE